jgi:uncharacterized protein (DUF2267 family)
VSYQQFVEAVRARTGLESPQVVEGAIAATLAVLGERLRRVDARAVAAELPEPLAQSLLSAQPAPGEEESIDADELVARVSDRMGAPAAARAALATCRVLAERLDEQARTHLRMQPLSPLFVSPPLDESP